MSKIMSPDTSVRSGILVISLDFELYWGMLDQTKLTPEYKEILQHTRDNVIPRLLELFSTHDIHVTWATVGLLFCDDESALHHSLPQLKARYENPSLSPYEHLSQEKINEENRLFYFAPELIQEISSYPHQEIGSHTFSHYYCLEEGQSAAMFESDAVNWNKLASREYASAKSLCFPRNQYSDDYIDVCKRLEIDSYRGNESAWFYQPAAYSQENINRKILRWLDTYFPVTSHQCMSIEEVGKTYPYNIGSTRFLRSYYDRLRWFEPLKQRRILSGMTYAAKRNRIYHLWWHPQDFGVDTEENFAALERILQHYKALKEKFSMQSLNMSEIASTLRSTKGKVY